MTRKRFVKLLMAKGYDRNIANKIAAEDNAKGKTYAEGYAEFEQVEKLLDMLVPAWTKTMERVTKVVEKVAQAISEGAAAFSKAYAAAMAEE